MRRWGWPSRSAVVLLAVLTAAGCGGSRSKSGASAPRRKPTLVSIGAGGVTGVYYQVGGAWMKLINRETDRWGVRASFQSTGGSVYNINAVLNGDLDFGLAQADKQYHAVHGQAEWKERGPQKDLRAVCSLYAECVTLAAADDAGIRSVRDLRGKRVNIGNPGSGQRWNAIQILEAAGIDWRKDLHAEGVKAAESAKLLQDGRIDAFFYTVGHPAGLITEATAGRRKVRLVPITEVDELLRRHPYYMRTVIPISYYPGAINSEDVPTIGMLTTIVTSAGTPEPVVYAVTRVLFEHLDEFRTMHPAFQSLDPRRMAADGLSAPLHPGAVRWFREAGLLPRDEGK